VRTLRNAQLGCGGPDCCVAAMLVVVQGSTGPWGAGGMECSQQQQWQQQQLGSSMSWQPNERAAHPARATQRAEEGPWHTAAAQRSLSHTRMQCTALAESGSRSGRVAGQDAAACHCSNSRNSRISSANSALLTSHTVHTSWQASGVCSRPRHPHLPAAGSACVLATGLSCRGCMFCVRREQDCCWSVIIPLHSL
jgi:hypothetical protein